MRILKRRAESSNEKQARHALWCLSLLAVGAQAAQQAAAGPGEPDLAPAPKPRVTIRTTQPGEPVRPGSIRVRTNFAPEGDLC